MLNFRLAAVARVMVVATLSAGGGALADPPHSRELAAGAAFRDWRLECAVAGDCAIRATLRAADGSELLTLAAVGRGEAAALTLRTALPLLLPEGVTLVLGHEAPRAVAWRTCGAAGCVAEAPLEAGVLGALKRERVAEVTLTLEDGVRVRLPVSLLGFSAAWEALGDVVTE